MLWMDWTNCIFEYDARRCQRRAVDIAHPWCSTVLVVAQWQQGLRSGGPSTIKRSTRAQVAIEGGCTDLECLVPTASGKNAALWRLYPLDDFYWRIMLRDLCCLTVCDVEHACGVVSTARDNLVALLCGSEGMNGGCGATDLVPTNAEYGALMGIHGLALSLTACADLV